MDDTRLVNELLRVEHDRDRLIYWLLRLYRDREQRRPYRRPWQHVRRVLEDMGYPPDGNRAEALLKLGEPTRTPEDDHGRNE